MLLYAGSYQLDNSPFVCLLKKSDLAKKTLLPSGRTSDRTSVLKIQDGFSSRVLKCDFSLW